MNDSPRKVSPLRQRMIEEMRMRQLAPKTREAYIRAVLHFTGFLGRSPDTATAEELRRYQLHCVDRGISAVSLNATITGLKVFFEATRGQPELMAKMAQRRSNRGQLWRLPLRRRIRMQLASNVGHGQLAVIGASEVIRADRYLAVAARDVQHIQGLTQSRDGTA